MNSLQRIAMASLLLLAPIACQEAGQPLGTDNQAPRADAEGGGTYYDHDGIGRVPVTLDGSRSSDPDGEIVGYVWTESETSIATGMVPRIDLPLGRHVIVLTVTDDEGATDADAVIVNVKYRPDPEPDTNTAPAVAILSPASGDVFYDDEPITFVGRADDAEEGVLPGASLTWSLAGTSSGQLGTQSIFLPLGAGETVRGDDIPSGEYVVILTATDSNGARGVANIEITVLHEDSFAEDVLPFFVDYCAGCHGADRADGGIRLDGYEAILSGGNANGPLIVPGDPSQGILIPQVLSDHEPVGWGGNEFSYYFGTVVLPAWIEVGAPDN